MSERVHLSPRDDDQMQLSIGESQILLTELRIQHNSNFVYPHRVLGRGGASIALTDKQLAELMAEWMRYFLKTDEFRYHCQESVDFKFNVERKQRDWLPSEPAISELATTRPAGVGVPDDINVNRIH